LFEDYLAFGKQPCATDYHPGEAPGQPVKCDNLHWDDEMILSADRQASGTTSSLARLAGLRYHSHCQQSRTENFLTNAN